MNTATTTLTCTSDALVVGESLFATLKAQRICHVIYFGNKFNSGKVTTKIYNYQSCT